MRSDLSNSIFILQVVTNLRKASDDLIKDGFRCRTYKDMETLATTKSLSTWFVHQNVKFDLFSVAPS